MATSDPKRALANLLERDRMFTDALADEAAQADLTLLPVDGTRTPDELAAELAMRLGCAGHTPARCAHACARGQSSIRARCGASRWSHAQATTAKPSPLYVPVQPLNRSTTWLIVLITP